VFSVVIATPDVVGERMAGPGIRAWHLAAELAKHFPTTLVARLEKPEPAAFQMLEWPAKPAMREAEVLIGQPARGFRRMKSGQRMVYDLFDPVLLELREMYGRRPSLRQRLHFLAEQMRLQRATADGDLLVVATPNQRELYASERIIEIPFGTDGVGAGAPAGPAGESPAATQRRENLILWGGGTWEWLDPRTAVDAVVRLNQNGVDCRLLFLGRSRPNRALVDRRRESRLDELLAAGAPYVTANAEWVPYRQRFSWLHRSKIAMMLHRSTAEARYSIRTRLFDAIGTATPVIASEEGFAADLVAREGLGLVVPAEDVGAVAAAIERLLGDDALHASCVSNLERIRPRFAWPVVVRPLVEAVSRWRS
jgi:glycosyltransferase involved in cell wall biosynthesis